MRMIKSRKKRMLKKYNEYKSIEPIEIVSQDYGLGTMYSTHSHILFKCMKRAYRRLHSTHFLKATYNATKMYEGDVRSVHLIRRDEFDPTFIGIEVTKLTRMKYNRGNKKS